MPPPTGSTGCASDLHSATPVGGIAKKASARCYYQV